MIDTSLDTATIQVLTLGAVLLAVAALTLWFDLRTPKKDDCES